MKRQTISLVVLVLVAPIIVGTTTAEHSADPSRYGCRGDNVVPDGCICRDGDGWVFEIPVRGPAGGAVELFYLTFDALAWAGKTLVSYLYRESNQISGLQRHDDWCTGDLAWNRESADEVVIAIDF